MATISFETEESEVSKIKAVLKALGVKKLKVETDETEMTKEEFFEKLDKSVQQDKEGKVRVLTPELQKKLFKSVL